MGRSANLDRRQEPQAITVEVHLEEPDAKAVLAELKTGLLEPPRSIPSKYFYDDRGSQLFERICELPEYYQTRTEEALLRDVADRIVRTTGAQELVELGSGAATKTRVLLDAMTRSGQLGLYVPLDFSEGMLRRIAEELRAEYDGLRVHGVVGDFMKHLGRLPDGGRRLVIFLGGTIGNLDPDTEAVEFLSMVSDELESGDFFLLGTDLIKSIETVEAAYDDAQGVTAEFNRNILQVINRILEADFKPRAFAHRALYDRSRHWIELSLVAEEAQTVHMAALDCTVEIEAGEEIRTEISAKYDRPRVEQLLERSALDLVEWYSDPQGLFALSLAQKG